MTEPVRSECESPTRKGYSHGPQRACAHWTPRRAHRHPESGSSAELKLAGEQAGGDWAVVEWRVRAGDEPPIHTHTREDETLYVLDGSITAVVGDQRIDVEAGSYAALPKNVPHGLTVHGDEARLLVTVEPAGAEYSFVPP